MSYGRAPRRWLRMRFAGVSWRKFRPHQCPRCIHASKELCGEIDGIKTPRYCEQPLHKPFIGPDATNRDCKHFQPKELICV